jgi:hypothetical protein
LLQSGNSINCGTPPGIFQGSMRFSGTKPGSTATYSCMKGTYIVGSASSVCKHNGSWDPAPSCRVEYLTKCDNTFKNGDKGYTLRTG